MRKLGIEEWIVTVVQGMKENVRSHGRVGEGISEEFEVKVGVHHGSGVPWEDLYADNLVIISDF